jgi:hypothetical protein
VVSDRHPYVTNFMACCAQEPVLGNCDWGSLEGWRGPSGWWAIPHRPTPGGTWWVQGLQFLLAVQGNVQI